MKNLVNLLFSIYYIIIIIRVILSWFPHNRYHLFIQPIYLLTEPLLSPIRKGLPPFRIGIDASPFIVIILLWLVQQVILSFL